MAKFIKSIFQEKRKTSRVEGELEEKPDFTPPLDGRRKLSISRSGRMKQHKKKRNSLTLDLYGDDIQINHKVKSHVEYHVGATPANTPSTNKDQNSLDFDTSQHIQDKNPEEEIDKAFEILDKT